MLLCIGLRFDRTPINFQQSFSGKGTRLTAVLTQRLIWLRSMFFLPEVVRKILLKFRKSGEKDGKLPKMPMESQKPSPLVTAEQTSNENHSVGSVKTVILSRYSCHPKSPLKAWESKVIWADKTMWD
jgi:hypothetical protein